MEPGVQELAKDLPIILGHPDDLTEIKEPRKFKLMKKAREMSESPLPLYNLDKDL